MFFRFYNTNTYFRKIFILQKVAFNNPDLLGIISFNHVYVPCDNSSFQTTNLHIKPFWQSYAQFLHSNNY